PSREGVQPLAAVAEAITIIAPFNDVQKPAGSARIRIVVHREQPAEGIDRQPESVPETRGDAHQPSAIRPTAIDAASLAAAAQGGAVGANHFVRRAKVLAE